MDRDFFQSGIKLYRAKRYKNALEEFLQVKKDPSEDVDLSYYLGLCYANLEQYEDALVYLEQVVTLHTDLLMIYQCRLLLSYIYTITRRFKLAEFELDELLKAGFESPQVYSILSYSLYAQNNTDRSLEYLDKALEMEPENPNLLNSKGYINADKERDIEEALAYCKKAVRIKNDHPAYLDSLGWAYYKTGRYEEARVYLKRAYSMASGNKTIAGHLKAVMDAEKKSSGEEAL